MQTDREQVEAGFTEWFCKNYPGPDTIIHDPNWHAPRIFRAATHTLIRERDAAEALALERAAVVADDEDMAITQWGEDRNTKVAQETARQIAAAIRALASSPNALEEHDAQVRAEERRLSTPVAAALAAAISLLERGGKDAAPSDKMFEQMLTDYRRALEDYRAAIREQAK